jgi:23S rRNA pseudouridine2605 synthase
MLMRLQKIIAQAGIASRRKAEELITAGAVTLNGKVVKELGTKADPQKDHIKVGGRLIRFIHPPTYLLFHKPKGVVTTLSDPQGRPTVSDFLRGVKARVYPVGRLDYDSEGLLLLTNDGELAHALMHPRYEMPKTYEVKVKGVLTDEEIGQLTEGVPLPGGRLSAFRVEKMRKTEANSWLRVTLQEGKKRQIRRMMEKVGHPVLKLIRIRLATLELGDLAPGRYRHLTKQELQSLRSYILKRKPGLNRKNGSRPVSARVSVGGGVGSHALHGMGEGGWSLPLYMVGT